MGTAPAFKTTTRVCAICRKALRRLPSGTTESTLGFGTTLRRLGYQGDKAHPSCVKDAGRNRHVADPLRAIVNSFATSECPRPGCEGRSGLCENCPER